MMEIYKNMTLQMMDMHIVTMVVDLEKVEIKYVVNDKETMV